MCHVFCPFSMFLRVGIKSYNIEARAEERCTYKMKMELSVGGVGVALVRCEVLSAL